MTRWKRFVKFANQPLTFRRKKKIEVIPTSPVILLVSMKNGAINNAFPEGEKKVLGDSIRIKDFPIETGCEFFLSKHIDWKEFPMWRKEQFKKGPVNLDWGQIKGYLV